MRSRPAAWDYVDHYAMHTTVIKRIPLEGFETGVTWDALRTPLPLSLTEAVPVARLQGTGYLTRLLVPPGFLPLHATMPGMRPQGLMYLQSDQAFLVLGRGQTSDQ